MNQIINEMLVESILFGETGSIKHKSKQIKETKLNKQNKVLEGDKPMEISHIFSRNSIKL